MVQGIRPRTLKKFSSLASVTEAHWIPDPNPDIVSRETHGTTPLSSSMPQRDSTSDAFGTKNHEFSFAQVGDPADNASKEPLEQSLEFPCAIDIPPSYSESRHPGIVAQRRLTHTNAAKVDFGGVSRALQRELRTVEPAISKQKPVLAHPPSNSEIHVAEKTPNDAVAVPTEVRPKLPLPFEPLELINLPAVWWLADNVLPSSSFSFPDETRRAAAGSLDAYIEGIEHGRKKYCSLPRVAASSGGGGERAPTHVAFVDGGCSGTRGSVGGLGVVTFDLSALKAFLQGLAGGSSRGPEGIGGSDSATLISKVSAEQYPSLSAPTTTLDRGNPFLRGKIPPRGHALWGLCPVQKYYRSYSNTTNNRMELRAIVCALANVPPGSRVHVYTDSRYCMDSATKFLPSWLRRKKLDPSDQGGAALRVALAKEPKEEAPLNKDLMFYLAYYIRASGATFSHVKGHTNVHYNEMVDRLTWLGRSGGEKKYVDAGCYTPG